ncbi:uncharacterized protein PADG_00980 [Paracoccidioides brasiliensis Pb18]|uniref:Uncharacterized protein n=1 Tax=Paracoccidioides brasiliensis (strain Pb18) TaxID=502780 RepID=C1FYV4_PARBD|nr:uncharacterized protein PADG_00980 [Paracoccidioides brasiliensis Pb18]EEH44691.2 hypothetical protein PADG_00980 [Paracoccidioides brasiliensis Pb18]
MDLSQPEPVEAMLISYHDIGGDLRARPINLSFVGDLFQKQSFDQKTQSGISDAVDHITSPSRNFAHIVQLRE